MGKEEYIQTLIQQMRCQKAREAVAEEVESHIEEAAQKYEEYGLSKEDAYQRAVTQMGDPVEIGVEMDRIHRPRFAWRMFGMILLLSMLGLCMQYFLGRKTGYAFYLPQCMYTVLGIGAMLAVYFLDYSILGRYTFLFYGGWFALFLGLKLFVEMFLSYRLSNGSIQYLQMPMYLFVPILAAILYRYRGSGWKGIFCCLGFGILPVLLSVYVLHSLVHGIKMIFIFSLLLFLALGKGWFAVKKKRAMFLLGLGILGVPAIQLGLGMKYFFAQYQRARIAALFGREPQNYLHYMVKEVLGQSRIVGAGVYGEFLPDTRMAHTEFVFTQIIAAFGILAGVVVALLLIYLIVKVFGISIRQQNQLGQMIGTGCGLVFLVQVIEYVLMNLGIGIGGSLFLPFFSYGNISTVIFYLLLGLVLSIYRYKDIPLKAGMRCKTSS